MLHLNALGASGRTRRIDDIGYIVRGNRDRGRRRFETLEFQCRGVEKHARNFGRNEQLDEPRHGDDASNPCVLDNVSQAISGMRGIQWHIGGAGLQHGRDGHRHLDSAV